MTDPEAGQWWLDAARAESRIGEWDGPDPDLPTREEIEADERDERDDPYR